MRRDVPVLAAPKAQVLWALVQIVIGRYLALGADVRGRRPLTGSEPAGARDVRCARGRGTQLGRGTHLLVRVAVAPGAQRVAFGAVALFTRAVHSMDRRVGPMKARAGELVPAPVAVPALLGRPETSEVSV